jgi:hypothetical protein
VIVFTVFSEAMYLANFCLIYDIQDSIWFNYLCHDASNLATHLSVSQVYSELVLEKWQGHKSSDLLAKALPLLQTSLADPGVAFSDSTISSILSRYSHLRNWGPRNFATTYAWVARNCDKARWNYKTQKFPPKN